MNARLWSSLVLLGLSACAQLSPPGSSAAAASAAKSTTKPAASATVASPATANAPIPATPIGAHTTDVPSATASAWRYSGKLSLKVPPGPGQRIEQGGQANFELSGSAEVGQLELTAPTGSLVALAQWQPGLATLQTSKGQHTFATTDELTRELLGEPLPVPALFSWLRGQAWPESPAVALPAPQSGFEQLGWAVTLDRFADGVLEARQVAPPHAVLRLRFTPSP